MSGDSDEFRKTKLCIRFVFEQAFFESSRVFPDPVVHDELSGSILLSNTVPTESGNLFCPFSDPFSVVWAPAAIITQSCSIFRQKVKQKSKSGEK